jgi:hypothetical protein
MIQSHVLPKGANPNKPVLRIDMASQQIMLAWQIFKESLMLQLASMGAKVVVMIFGVDPHISNNISYSIIKKNSVYIYIFDEGHQI